MFDIVRTPSKVTVISRDWRGAGWLFITGFYPHGETGELPTDAEALTDVLNGGQPKQRQERRR